MVGCAAPNCSGNSRKGDCLFKFPSDKRMKDENDGLLIVKEILGCLQNLVNCVR